MVSNFGSKLTDKDNVCGLFLSGFDAMISQPFAQQTFLPISNFGPPLRDTLSAVERDLGVDFDTAMQMRFMSP